MCVYQYKVKQQATNELCDNIVMASGSDAFNKRIYGMKCSARQNFKRLGVKVHKNSSFQR